MHPEPWREMNRVNRPLVPNEQVVFEKQLRILPQVEKEKTKKPKDRNM